MSDLPYETIPHPFNKGDKRRVYVLPVMTRIELEVDDDLDQCEIDSLIKRLQSQEMHLSLISGRYRARSLKPTKDNQ